MVERILERVADGVGEHRLFAGPVDRHLSVCQTALDRPNIHDDGSFPPTRGGRAHLRHDQFRAAGLSRLFFYRSRSPNRDVFRPPYVAKLTSRFFDPVTRPRRRAWTRGAAAAGAEDRRRCLHFLRALGRCSPPPPVCAAAILLKPQAPCLPQAGVRFACRGARSRGDRRSEIQVDPMRRGLRHV
jgi:hypothetical protein